MQLVNHASLTPEQHARLGTLSVLPEQKRYVGAIDAALHDLLNKPADGVCGFVLLVGGVPQAFMLLKRGPYLPHWAAPDAATLHSFQVDWRGQGRGWGRYCLRALPAMLREHWPPVRRLQLSVDEHNLAALGLYRAMGWTDSGTGFRAAVGYERQLTLMVAEDPVMATRC